MKSLFDEFQPDNVKRHLHTAETSHRKNITVLSSWIADYQTLLADETGNLFWQVNSEHLASVYAETVENIRHFDYSGHDIGAFCTKIDQGSPIPLHVPGPLGIYVSALINCCKDREITLFTSGMRHIIHFLGYRLSRGKRLTINGNSGDFTGTGLCGGSLVINGSAGNYCGAGMTEGKIEVRENAGLNLGQWMHGGTIQVDGTVSGIGENRFGGQVMNNDGTEPSF